MTLLIVVNVQC